MNLHLDREAFTELVTATANELHIRPVIIEKDYLTKIVETEIYRNDYETNTRQFKKADSGSVASRDMV